MKRIIAIGFISLATMVIMVHAIVPHHHHGGMPVPLSSEVCKTKHECHGHGDCHDADDGHSHDHSSEDCLIHDLYFRLENEKQIKYLNVADFSQVLHFIIVFCEDLTFKALEYGNLPFRGIPYSESYHTVYITHSLGLRAPPVC